MTPTLLAITFLAILAVVIIASLLLVFWPHSSKDAELEYVTLAHSPSFVAFPPNTKHKHNDSSRHNWPHPYGFPYRVYGGRLNMHDLKQVWVKTRTLSGYKLIADHYSDRLYFVSTETPESKAPNQ